jgi:hypothetical protein
MMPGSRRTWPIWQCGLYPGVGLAALGLIGWGLYLMDAWDQLMLLMFLGVIPIMLAAIVWAAISIRIRVRQADPGTRWRTLFVCLAICFGWIVPGTLAFYSAFAVAVSIVTSI